MGFAYKKGTKVKKKPKNYSKYIDFANTTEANQIEIPTLQTNTTDTSKTKPSELINYFQQAVSPANFTALGNQTLIYTFKDSLQLNELDVQYSNSAYLNVTLTFYVAILRGSTVMLRYDFDYDGNISQTSVLSFEKQFNNVVLQSGDQIVWYIISGLGSPVGVTHEFRVKGVLN